MRRRQSVAYVCVCGAILGLLASAACHEKQPESKVTVINLKTAKIVENPNRGWLDNVSLQDGKIVASGWAMNADTRGLPDLVVIANQNLDTLATVQPSLDRPDLAKILPQLAKSGFGVIIDPARVISTGTTAISAYAYSTSESKANPQWGIWTVTVEGGKITKVAQRK